MRYLYASDDECAAGCFKQDFMPSIGHHSVVPVLAAATGGASREVVVVGGDSGRGLTLGRVAELDASACAFCARAAETMLAEAELPSTTGCDDEDVRGLKHQLLKLLVLRTFAKNCRMQSRCSLR